MLIKHLVEVYEINADKIDDNYKKAYEIASFCHDFGKYTTYFQDYLMMKKRTIYTDHGFLSALFTAFAAIETFEKNSNIPLILFNCVLHHHGDLKNSSESLPHSFKEFTSMDHELLEKLSVAEKQLENIKENRLWIEADLKEIGYDHFFNKFMIPV
jgi:CRISPR-associated endonuclease/helicase Cas3